MAITTTRFVLSYTVPLKNLLVIEINPLRQAKPTKTIQKPASSYFNHHHQGKFVHSCFICEIYRGRFRLFLYASGRIRRDPSGNTDSTQANSNASK